MVHKQATKPPTFVIFVNDKTLFHFSYERYLVNQFRNNFGMQGTPIRIIVREKGGKINGSIFISYISSISFRKYKFFSNF